MNRKRVLNITLDKNRSNSAATGELVTDLEAKLGPYTRNNVYREIFVEFYDFSDANNYKLTTGMYHRYHIHRYHIHRNKSQHIIPTKDYYPCSGGWIEIAKSNSGFNMIIQQNELHNMCCHETMVE